MFEQVILTNGPDSKRVWTSFLGLTSQVALVSLAVLAPMVWPQVLPATRFWESLAPPMPPAPKPLGEVKQHPSHVRIIRETGWNTPFIQPTHIPVGPIPIIQDEPVGTTVVGVPVGFGQSGPSVMDSIFREMVGRTARVAPPRVPEPVRQASEPVAAIPRLRTGGNVHLGQVLHKAEPQYPQIAKAARIAGEVELECVVGVDGHIQEVKVISGHPMLVRAAVDAAWQWVYGPSQLNGSPIEIVTILRFSFKLN